MAAAVGVKGLLICLTACYVYPSDALYSAIYAVAGCLSVRLSHGHRLSICHDPVLCQNGETSCRNSSIMGSNFVPLSRRQRFEVELGKLARNYLSRKENIVSLDSRPKRTWSRSSMGGCVVACQYLCVFVHSSCLKRAEVRVCAYSICLTG